MVRNSILVCVFGLLSMSDSFAAEDKVPKVPLNEYGPYIKLRNSIDLSSPLDTEPLSKQEYNALLKKTYEEQKEHISNVEESSEIANLIERYISYDDCESVDPQNSSAKYANKMLSTFIMIEIFRVIYGINCLRFDDIQKAIFEIEGAEDLCEKFESNSELSVIKPAKH